MFIIANLIMAVAKVADILLNILMWCILIRALISWVNPDPYNVIVQMLNKVTEPILRPIRTMIPLFSTGLDLSPFIACLVIIFLQGFLVKSLYQIASVIQSM